MNNHIFFLISNHLKILNNNTFFVQLTLTQPVANEVFSFDVIYQSDSSNKEREQDLTGFYFNEEITRLPKTI